MALVVHLKEVTRLRGRGDRLAKLTFRGSCRLSKLVENSDEDAIFEEIFEWPVARPIENYETLEIQFVNYNKYFNNRIVGNYGLVLQKVIEDGYLKITDSLLDSNNMPMKSMVSLEIRYCCPDSSSSSLQGASPDYHCFDDDQQTLLDIEQNIANLEKSLAVKESSTTKLHSKASRSASLSSARSLERKRLTVKTLTSMMRLGKQRPTADDCDKLSLKDSDQGSEFGSTQSLDRHLLDGVMKGRRLSMEDDSVNTDDDDSVEHSYSSSRKLRSGSILAASALKAQDFQVCITVIEARQLAGLNMDPVVCVQVGNTKKYTGVKESTNCPYYNEYFVFDFHMAPAMLFDKMITLTILHSRNIIRSGKVLGQFKMDVGTVWSQSGNP